jgi:DNA-directed RNA polymerase specialized sigma24 family protein
MTQKRALSREQSLDDSTLAPAALDRRSSQPTPSEVAIAREQWERMAQDQPAHYRQIIVLRLHGYTYQAIADELGLSERTVRRVLVQLLHNRVSESSRARIEQN